jgi:eukaryotic-like serine/threonine-protein kinase
MKSESSNRVQLDSGATRVTAANPAMLADMRSRGRVMLIGRYELACQLATGGMASVHLGRIRGAQGFSRVVAIKRILPEYAEKPDFVKMFVNEARLAARVRHPNVVATLDAVEHEDELLLVMEFVPGLSLGKLAMLASDCNARIPLRMGATIVASALRGLHAAHEAKDEAGRALGIVHRDVSPQNILVGRDGLARVLDFGVAKAVDQTRLTMFGEFKGKLTYAAPEQVLFQTVTRATDIYAAGIVLWELATGERRYGSRSHGAIIHSLSTESVPMPTTRDRTLPRALDRIIHYATQRNPSFRYRSAADMAREIEEQIGVAPAPEVTAWLAQVAGAELERLDQLVADIETQRDVSAEDLALAVSPTELDYAPTELTPELPLARRRWATPLAGVLAGATVVLGASGAYSYQNRHAGGPPASGAAEARLADPGARMLITSAATAIATEPGGTTSPSASPEVATRVIHPRPSPPPPVASTAPPPPRAPECSPPYFLDADGIKHVKPGCG